MSRVCALLCMLALAVTAPAWATSASLGPSLPGGWPPLSAYVLTGLAGWALLAWTIMVRCLACAIMIRYLKA